MFATPLFVITTSKAPIKGLGGAAHPMLYAPIRTVGHHQNRLGLAAVAGLGSGVAEYFDALPVAADLVVAAAAGLGSGIVVLAAGTVTDLVAAAAAVADLEVVAGIAVAALVAVALAG